MDASDVQVMMEELRRLRLQLVEELGSIALTVEDQGRGLREALLCAEQEQPDTAGERRTRRRAWAGQFAASLLRAVARELLTDQDEDRVSAAVTRLMERAWQASGILEVVSSSYPDADAEHGEGVDLGAPMPLPPEREVRVEGGEP